MKSFYFLLCFFTFCANTRVLADIGVNGKPLTNTIGITHTGSSYNMNPNLDDLTEGANRILELGSRVIKLWYADTTVMKKSCYPYNIKWGNLGITNSVDMAKCKYFDHIFNMDFDTYVLETATFNFSKDDVNVKWEDGMTPQECDRVEDEMYQLTKYFMTHFNGTRKKFVLQNWEGDNMLENIKWRYNNQKGLYYKVDKGYESANTEDDTQLKTKIRGLIDWFNYRQKGVDKARNELKGKSDVVVRHALEVSFVYLNKQDDGWPFADTPLLIDHVIQYTDCDLYSYSSWATHTIARACQLRPKLEIIERRLGKTYIDIYDNNTEKPRRENIRKGQKTKLMLGEYGAIEGMQFSDSGKWGRGFDYSTSRRQRMVIQIQTDIAEAMGLEYIIFWQLYCCVPRGDILKDVVDMVKGDRIQKNEYLQGNWLIRVDGTCTDGYSYFHGLLCPKEALYANTHKAMYQIDGAARGFEVQTSQLSAKILDNIRDKEQYKRKITVLGSINGKNYMPIETDCFFIDNEIDGGKVTTKISYINKCEIDAKYRYFKVVVNDKKECKVHNVRYYKTDLIY